MHSTDDEEMQTALAFRVNMEAQKAKQEDGYPQQTLGAAYLTNAAATGEHNNLLQEMRLCDHESHFSHLRMSKQTFGFLLEKIRMCNRIN